MSIERAHRDGQVRVGRERHVLLKLSNYQDNVHIMKNSGHVLYDEQYCIIDNSTRKYLIEKRKWMKRVDNLSSTSTRLRFVGGKWMDGQ